MTTLFARTPKTAEPEWTEEQTTVLGFMELVTETYRFKDDGKRRYDWQRLHRVPVLFPLTDTGKFKRAALKASRGMEDVTAVVSTDPHDKLSDAVVIIVQGWRRMSKSERRNLEIGEFAKA